MAHQHCAQGKGALDPSRERGGGLEAHLGLDGLDVVGALRGRLVLGLLGDELCEGSEIPGVSGTVGRQSLEARGFSIRRSRRWLRDVDRRR